MINKVNNTKIIAKIFLGSIISEDKLLKKAKKSYLKLAYIGEEKNFVIVHIQGSPLSAFMFLRGLQKEGIKSEVIKRTFPKKKSSGLSGIQIFRFNECTA